jgi:predicted ATPase
MAIFLDRRCPSTTDSNGYDQRGAACWRPKEELSLLLRRWSRANAGDGQVGLISGEAGIEKSRLTAALMERVAAEPHTRLRYFRSPQHMDSALYPIISQTDASTSAVES